MSTASWYLFLEIRNLGLSGNKINVTTKLKIAKTIAT